MGRCHNRNYRNREAGFTLHTFNSDGELLDQSINLDAASPLTYDAEFTFGLDLNNDNHQGRYIKIVDESSYQTQHQLHPFGAASNTQLLTDPNSGDLLSSKQETPTTPKPLSLKTPLAIPSNSPTPMSPSPSNNSAMATSNS